jgi:hypothetical protein
MGKSFKKSKFEEDLDYLEYEEVDEDSKKDAYKNRRNKKQHTRQYDENE